MRKDKNLSNLQINKIYFKNLYKLIHFVTFFKLHKKFSTSNKEFKGEQKL